MGSEMCIRDRRKTGEQDDAKWIHAQIDARNQARKKKDFSTADKIRKQLLSKGIVLEDDGAGTKWKRVVKK